MQQRFIVSFLVLLFASVVFTSCEDVESTTSEEIAPLSIIGTWEAVSGIATWESGTLNEDMTVNAIDDQGYGVRTYESGEAVFEFRSDSIIVTSFDDRHSGLWQLNSAGELHFTWYQVLENGELEESVEVYTLVNLSNNTLDIKSLDYNTTVNGLDGTIYYEEDIVEVSFQRLN